jgi:hypothetical protein
MVMSRSSHVCLESLGGTATQPTRIAPAACQPFCRMFLQKDLIRETRVPCKYDTGKVLLEQPGF